MIFGIFTLLVALAISGIAAYYSIVGLTAIFSAAVIPIIIMGAALEVGKVTAAVWLKLNWNRANITYKLYLVPAVAVLMLLTSMGIFGFLSKAHSDQSLSTSNADANIVIIDEKIRVERDAIELNRKALKQLDEQVDQVMVRSKDERGAERAAQIRRNQQRERAKILQDIEASQKRITQLNEERAPLAAQFRKIESEVGPIKYIAALVYEENPDGTVLEKAVRLVIIIIVAVFDPLALVLILAAQQSLRWASEERRQRKQKALETAVPEIKNNNPTPLQDEQGNASATVNVPNNPSAPLADQFNIDDHPYLKKPWKHFGKLEPMVATESNSEPTSNVQPVVETVVESQIVEPQLVAESNVAIVEETISKNTVSEDVVDRNGPLEAMELKRGHRQVPAEAAERPNQKKVNRLAADNENSDVREVQAHFGISFPDNPNKGDLYLRVDYLPTKLYKFNGSKWIEVDKNLTDSYVYNTDYIKYLVNQIDQGKIDLDDLSVSERNQLVSFLEKNEQGRNPA
jgi:hypothetical protein